MKRKSAEITQQLQGDFQGVILGIGCFDGTFSLQVKTDSKPYKAPQRCVAYTLQRSLQVKTDSKPYKAPQRCVAYTLQRPLKEEELERSNSKIS